MRSYWLVVLGLVLFASAAAPVSAADDGTWVFLGKRDVAPTAERDVIRVTAWEGKFNAVRLHVAHRGVQMMDLKLHFRNGATQDVVLRTHIPAGGTSRVIDLNGDDRVITHVTLSYRTRSRFAGRAVVSLFGRRVSLPAVVAEPTPPKPVPTWMLLGSRHVNFVTDKDVVPVTASEGRFTKIQLEVWESGVEIIDLKVRFGNGTFVDYAIKSFIAKGGKTRILDLPGDERVIRQVDIVYRSRGLLSGRALVRVWGLKDPTPYVAPQPPPAQPKPAQPTPANPTPANPTPANPTPGAQPEKPYVPVKPLGTWEKLGSRLVAGRTDRDVIPVTGIEGRFRKIQLRVGGKRIRILDLKVHFGDGGTFDVAVRSEIPAGGSTRVIDLPGGARIINRVTIVYKHLGRRIGQPIVNLWGMH